MTVYFADVEGYRYREIAAMTSVPVGTVMSRLARGRRRLRELLADVSTQHQRVSTVTSR
jgi:RNA polymerase sigma-70 factor (ECF subfamily)